MTLKRTFRTSCSLSHLSIYSTRIFLFSQFEFVPPLSFKILSKLIFSEIPCQTSHLRLITIISPTIVQLDMPFLTVKIRHALVNLDLNLYMGNALGNLFTNFI